MFAVGAGWELSRVCGVLELDRQRVWRWQARQASGTLDDPIEVWRLAKLVRQVLANLLTLLIVSAGVEVVLSLRKSSKLLLHGSYVPGKCEPGTVAFLWGKADRIDSQTLISPN
jgi:hypothetical protein